MHQSGSARLGCSNNHPQPCSLATHAACLLQPHSMPPHSKIQADGIATTPKYCIAEGQKGTKAHLSLIHEVSVCLRSLQEWSFWGERGTSET